jgi:hypothetical protein
MQDQLLTEGKPIMGLQKYHYRSETKAGFSAGELRTILSRHSAGADYRVVVNFRGKVREVVVEEAFQDSSLVDERLEEASRLAGEGCATPGSVNWERRKEGLPPAGYQQTRYGRENPARPWPAAEEFGAGTGQPARKANPLDPRTWTHENGGLR